MGIRHRSVGKMYHGGPEYKYEKTQDPSKGGYDPHTNCHYHHNHHRHHSF